MPLELTLRGICAVFSVIDEYQENVSGKTAIGTASGVEAFSRVKAEAAERAKCNYRGFSGPNWKLKK